LRSLTRTSSPVGINPLSFFTVWRFVSLIIFFSYLYVFQGKSDALKHLRYSLGGNVAFVANEFPR
jgi:hypothetical protein